MSMTLKCGNLQVIRYDVPHGDVVHLEQHYPSSHITLTFRGDELEDALHLLKRARTDRRQDLARWSNDGEV